MAEPYLKNLAQIVGGLDSSATLEPKHFFSGAALYANGKICATLSPTGFALKLPEDVRQRLIAANDAGDFRFFPNGPIKRDYAALSKSLIDDKEALQELLTMSIHFVSSGRD